MGIIAAVDRSNQRDAVVDQAVELADAFGETVHFVHVLTRSDFIDLERTSVDETGQPIKLDRIQAIAKEIAEHDTDSLSVPWESAGLVGNPADEVVKYADDQDARYIVIGGRKRSPTGKALFGSVTQSIILNADCPTMITVAQ